MTEESNSRKMLRTLLVVLLIAAVAVGYLLVGPDKGLISASESSTGLSVDQSIFEVTGEVIRGYW